MQFGIEINIDLFKQGCPTDFGASPVANMARARTSVKGALEEVTFPQMGIMESALAHAFLLYLFHIFH